MPKTVLARQQVIDFEADSVKRRLPPVVTGNYERKIADQVWRVLPQDAALAQRFHD